ncbi:hypothetical protein DH2020_030158 [Rehmannia glutinosa]|uniref:Protein kinase domain-containing protein n=1 Tax=Rehmannia glutinosa TaxID=99300 RepID=A0ABR0VP43_REHGL
MERSFNFITLATLLLIHSLIQHSLARTTTNTSTDQSSLLALKSHITSDPHNILTNNWTTQTSKCTWTRVTCGSRHLRAIALDISDMNLKGNIPPEIGNLTFLVSLNMSSNFFQGNLPKELSRLRRLRIMDFTWNNFTERSQTLEEIGNLPKLKDLRLQNNKLSGPIPATIFNISSLEFISLRNNNLSGSLPVNMCSNNLMKLRTLILSRNMLYGEIPPSLFRCSQLQILGLANNNFSGLVPREIGNITAVQQLLLGFNTLSGVIPQGTSNIYELEALALASNSLTGSVPVGIFNMSKLRAISMDRNLLSGNLPTSFNLPNLEELYLGTNSLKGQILNSVTNCSKLTTLELAFNKFSGSIPNSLNNLSLLKILNLNGNNFTSEPSLSFLTSLTECRYLEELLISNNPLDGILPPTIGNFSSSLRYIIADNCRIKGSIPGEIGNLSSLEILSLINNNLIGIFPVAIQGLQKLQRLFLGTNQLTGSFPSSICTFQNLGSLDLTSNQISGPIPECLSNVTYLRELFLSSNQLDSNIPESLWNNHEDLLRLDLSSNFLSGSLSPNIGNLRKAVGIDLSGNVFSGTIPSTIGSLQALTRITLAHNQFHGSIPESMSNMLSLESLDLSQNNLSGVIPKSLDTLVYLTYFNVSYNDLSGEIPSDGPFMNFSDQSFVANDDLCGDPRFHVPPCRISSVHNSRNKIVIFVPVAVAIVIIATVVIIVLVKYQKKNQTPNLLDLLSPLRQRRISYYELQQATDGYSESNLLGMGGYGAVYKGLLRDGTVLAVKVFNLQVEGAVKSFDAECEVLRNLRHRNLTKVICSCCSHDGFKALVLEYMPKGSLERWLYSYNYFLDFLQRLNIMIDVASALEYLHHGYSTPVIHCDLKPSNVLLDEDMVAHVSDFGMAKLLAGEDSVTHTRTLATWGYMAPEYGMQGTVSPRCDVYSYGIMLMEVFVRTKPNDERFNAFCTAELPRERTDMKDVVSTLKKIKLELLACTGEHTNKST